MPFWVMFAILLLAFLGELFTAPFLNRRERTPEVGLARRVDIVHVVIAGGTTTHRVAGIALSPTPGIRMPVREFWPRLPASAGAEGPSAQVVSGGFTQALVEVQGLAPGTR